MSRDEQYQLLKDKLGNLKEYLTELWQSTTVFNPVRKNKRILPNKSQKDLADLNEAQTLAWRQLVMQHTLLNVLYELLPEDGSEVIFDITKFNPDADVSLSVNPKDKTVKVNRKMNPEEITIDEEAQTQ